MKRSEYACAELEIVYISGEDVIATSTTGGDDLDSDGWDKL